MLRSLFLNACVLVTLTYALSLTYRQWPLSGGPWPLLRLLAFAGMGAVLLLFPAELGPGVVLDLRAVPALLVTLEYGLLQGLGVAAAILSVRYLQGGAGVVPGALALLIVTLAAGGARRYAGLTLKHLMGRRAYWAALLCLPYPLTLLMLPAGEAVFARLAAPLVLMNAAGLLLCVSVLVGRFQTLQATRSLVQQAELDALTSLPNRRRFDADLMDLGAQDALLLIDIDHFKRVNDMFGHQAGDEVLQQVAARLAGVVRPRDTVYRYGGEEFAVILKQVRREQLTAVAERLRVSVENLPLSSLNGGSVTVSVGVACQGSGVALVQRADSALYVAKHAGRNRVHVAPGSLESGQAD
ncbi:diguanylate cyclase [Deinococcus sp. A31D244]|uniref:GGDEF domain-containing protein n=1 Tax=Deinococcus sp. A31D244 TaxID=3397675 RepID=UPI0039E19119